MVLFMDFHRLLRERSEGGSGDEDEESLPRAADLKEGKAISSLIKP